MEVEKRDYILALFNDIKDNIEFDSDIIALNTLLESLLEIDIKKSFNCFLDLINKYHFSDLKYDIDITILFNNYLLKYIKKTDLETFFKNTNDINQKNKNLIYYYLFNIYNDNFFFYQDLELLIKKQDLSKIDNLIKLIINKSSNFPKEVFNLKDFLKHIISLFIKLDYIPTSYLNNLINNLDSKKDQAVLKTLLIDYE